MTITSTTRISWASVSIQVTRNSDLGSTGRKILANVEHFDGYGPLRGYETFNLKHVTSVVSNTGRDLVRRTKGF